MADQNQIKADLYARQVAKDIKLVVKYHYQGWKVRLWIAMQLIRLAAWIAWVDVEFEDLS